LGLGTRIDRPFHAAKRKRVMIARNRLGGERKQIFQRGPF
jgi:hypothetical protein